MQPQQLIIRNAMNLKESREILEGRMKRDKYQKLKMNGIGKKKEEAIL